MKRSMIDSDSSKVQTNVAYGMAPSRLGKIDIHSLKSIIQELILSGKTIMGGVRDFILGRPILYKVE